MKLYIRQTRQILRHNTQNNTIYIPDEPLTEWEENDSIFHYEEEFLLQKSIPITEGFVFTEERFVPITNIEVKSYNES